MKIRDPTHFPLVKQVRGQRVLDQEAGDDATDEASNTGFNVAGRTGGGGGLRRRRRWGGFRGGRSFGVGLGLGSGLGRHPVRDCGPGVEEASSSNSLGVATDNCRRCPHDRVKHPLSLGQDTLRGVVGVARVGVVAAVACGILLAPLSCSS